MNESATILTPASAQAEDARPAGAESLNGNGFYRFKIGNFQATMISDGYGPIPVGPIFAMNASEAELAPVLKANFMPPVIQATNNLYSRRSNRRLCWIGSSRAARTSPRFTSPRARRSFLWPGIASGAFPARKGGR